MDAQFYQSITGLTNYDGFKSQLKNSAVGTRYNIEDENIIFNAVRVIATSGAAFINLKINQVAVILNAPFAARSVNNVVAANFDDIWYSVDVDGNSINFMGEGSQGLIVQTTVGTTSAALLYTCQLAIFDLF